MIQTPVYMDYHATTPVDAKVLEAMFPYFTKNFGNPASRQHQFGWQAEEGVEQSRTKIASLIGAEPKEIFFTGSSTESNNLVLKGIAEAWRPKGNHIITVQTEHKSILDTCKRLDKTGCNITYLGVDEFGFIDLQKLENSITDQTILVSVMLANNEIGVIQSVREIGAICRAKGILFHTDATQGLAYNDVNVKNMNVDLMSFNAHKIYGPKGIGALYIRSASPKIKIVAQMEGGGHEKGLRSGTLNVPAIVGFAKALELCNELREDEVKKLCSYRDRMLETFTNELGDVYLNGPRDNRLPHNLNLSFLHVDYDTLMMSMKDVAVSTGSACSTGLPEPSYVLKALRLSRERLVSAIRFGLGRYTTSEEVDYVIGRVIESVRKLRSNAPRQKNNLEQFV